MLFSYLVAAASVLHLVEGSRMALQPFGPHLSHRTFITEGNALGGAKPGNPIDVATAYLLDHLHLEPHSIRQTDAFTTAHTGVTHVHFRGVVDGVDVANAVANVNVGPDGTIISVGSSIPSTHASGPSNLVRASGTWLSSASHTASPIDAVVALAAHIGQPVSRTSLREDGRSNLDSTPDGSMLAFVVLGVPYAQDGVLVRPAYIQGADGAMVPAWDIRMRTNGNWIHAHVDRAGQKVLSLVDWVKDAQYRAISLRGTDPVSSPPALISDPASPTASPLGWHATTPERHTTFTAGNNVFAQSNWEGLTQFLDRPRADGGKDLIFDPALSLESTDPHAYVNASITNVFYQCNALHDLLYAYGFTETAGNFQESNFGRGGKGGDAVVAHVQDASGESNGSFATPPDGERGVLRLSPFSIAPGPPRDGALATEVVAHEYVHGLSERLTGGPSNSDCLAWGEAAGMGEGWSDIIPLILGVNSTTVASRTHTIGTWILGSSHGARRYPYSTSLAVNPIDYDLLNDPAWKEPHATGEIWCSMLWEVLWNLIDAIPFPLSPDLLAPSPDHGDSLMLQILVDAMKLQPCQPTFLSARDAILLAERLLTDGEHACGIWRGFAKRGLGLHAASDGEAFTRDDSVPPACMPKAIPATA